ncbi:MAG: ATP-binding cassette domain-containing protein [Blautia sp.]|uniref:ATP-binding cassette domain-containing protein n=1 Tax=Blautia sp. TaxID=1955243 RepID=UPI0025B8CA27|nr:ATP-binding cassette domain-containing protein [Blautia sp.]MCI6304802.1 ATP-binding cassette domain-containing protein [Blautia sp.]MDD6413441.1 ATP-binding cassette domain-containing protein [Blautia sp.]MDY4114807.1 ATP-binding cassette domain-containing protein [Blautia sp.]
MDNNTNKKAPAKEPYFFHTDQLTVGYDGKPLIREINIQLKKGEILTLIGPNGAGKSTILKSITRQLATISGTVYLDKQLMSQMSNKEVSQKLAVVLTERMRPELMTCEDIVATGRYPYTGTLGILSAEDKVKVKEAMETVHAWDLKDRDFTAISDGQRQRILLARAICQEPEIIVLDEPTSFLDIRHKLELLTILKQMVLDNQLTVIMSLHELDLAQKVSDKVICVHGEHIEKYGAPEEIFTSDYIRNLYGITRGSYNAAFGCVEMEPPKGTPQIFVIGGNGSGIPIYRKLQRQGIPFAAGVLHTNDVDYQVASALAAQVVAEKTFECISQKNYENAAELMKQCQKVICPLKEFGTMNAANKELLNLARKLGILVKDI